MIFISFVEYIFNAAVSGSNCIALTDRIISEQWVGKDVERKGHSLIWGAIPFFAWETEENKEITSVRKTNTQA